MSPLETTAAAASIFFCYKAFNSINKISPATVERLNAFPMRKTAFKIGALFAQISYVFISFTCLGICARFICSLATGQDLCAISNLFKRSMAVSVKLTYCTFFVSVSCILYARTWDVNLSIYRHLDN